jgi:hypothetical protein
MPEAVPQLANSSVAIKTKVSFMVTSLRQFIRSVNLIDPKEKSN